MKKVLIATTALVATAGMAAADINLSGASRFGLVYTEGAADETVVHNRFTLNIDGTAETDGGAEFFARVRVRGGNSAGTGGTTAASGVSAPRVGVRASGLTLAVGNINGALESTPGLYSGAVGLTGLGWGNLPLNNSVAGNFYWDSFSSAGGGVNGVEVIYSSGDFGVHVSTSEVTDQTAINVSYSFGDWTVALGYMDDGDSNIDATLLTVGGSAGAVDFGIKAAEVNSGAMSSTNVTLWGSFDVGAGTTITAYATSVDVAGSDDVYGLGFTHSLGGAVLAGGIASNTAGNNVADLGVRFNF